MDRRLSLRRTADALAALNRGETGAIAPWVAEDVIWRDVALSMPLHGRDALLDAVRAYLRAFPDLRIEATSTTFSAPRLVIELTLTGTHRGELLGIPPTGRWTENYAAVVLTVDEDGMLVEGSMYWNALTMMCQLGVATPLDAVTV